MRRPGVHSSSSSEGSDEYFREHGFHRSIEPFRRDRAEERIADVRKALRKSALIVDRGSEAFFADNDEGEMYRWLSYYCVIRVAEGLSKLHSDVKELNPEVDWLVIGRMRNLVVHHYERIDDDYVWNTLVSDFPQLSQRLAALAWPE